MAYRILWILLLVAPLTYGKPLIIGTSGDNPPFSMRIDAKKYFYGFDIEIIGEICKRIQATCSYKSYGFSKIFAAIDNQEIDLAISAITISKSREQRYLFSRPYYVSDAQFMTFSQSPINALDDLKDKHIGVIGNPTKELVQTLYKGHITVIEYPSILELLDGLNKKEIDAVVMDKGEVQYWFANSGDLYKMIPPAFNYGAGYGIMANKNQSVLMKQVDDALQSMRADKTYDIIYARYFGSIKTGA